MAILYDDGFWAELNDSRTLVITGRLSSGKTLLVTELAEKYLKKGYRFVSQMSCVWNDDIDTLQPMPDGSLKVFCNIDEGGLYFRTFKSASAVSSFLAKMDMFAVFSGKKMPHEDLCGLTCQVWMDLQKYFLIPIKIWRYDVENGRKKYSGFFIQTGWWHYFGVYSTTDPGDNPKRIVSFFKKWTKYYFDKYEREYDVSDVETGGGDNLTESINEFGGAVRNLSSTASTLSRRKKGW